MPSIPSSSPTTTHHSAAKNLPALRDLAPFWILPAVFDGLSLWILHTRPSAVFIHVIALVIWFHTWHRLLHDPRAGELFRLHRLHHAKLYPASRLLTAHYEGEGGSLQQISLALGALVILLLSALCGTSAKTVCACACVFTLLLAGGNWFHHALHRSPTRMERFAWFRRMREYHFVHHLEQNKNFGIIEYGFDGLTDSWKSQRDST